MIKAVLFDMDGLLFDTERMGEGVMDECAANQGQHMSAEQWKALLGCTLPATKVALEKYYGASFDGDRFHADWCRIMLEHVRRDGVPVKVGAAEALDALRRRGIKTAVVTSNAAHVVAEYLARSGFTDKFDAVITGDMAAKSKPEPDIYLKGAEVLGVSPAECAGVEDSYNGVRAIRAAGMRSVMIPDVLPFTEAQRPFVDDCLTSLNELEGTLFPEG